VFRNLTGDLAARMADVHQATGADFVNAKFWLGGCPRGGGGGLKRDASLLNCFWISSVPIPTPTDINTGDDNCNVRRNVVKPSTFDIAYSGKSKLHIFHSSLKSLVCILAITLSFQNKVPVL
jgi:hypothetical protein